MKRSFRTLCLLALSLLLLTVTALADMGPKPQLTVEVKNAPQEPYYLDLLAEGDAPSCPSLTEEELAALDADLYGRLLAAIPAGWHGCVSQGTDGAVAVMALQAGNDMVVTTDYRSQIPKVLEAVENGSLEEAAIDAACRRVLRWKQALGLLPTEPEV